MKVEDKERGRSRKNKLDGKQRKLEEKDRRQQERK